jgi:hypothetical protein
MGQRGKWATGQQGNRATGQRGNRAIGQQGNRATGQQGNGATGQQGNKVIITILRTKIRKKIEILHYLLTGCRIKKKRKYENT